MTQLNSVHRMPLLKPAGHTLSTRKLNTLIKGLCICKISFSKLLDGIDKYAIVIIVCKSMIQYRINEITLILTLPVGALNQNLTLPAIILR